MPEDRRPLDESLTIDGFWKSFTGKGNVRPALDRIEISPTGHVQPKAAQPSEPTTSNSQPANSRDEQK